MSGTRAPCLLLCSLLLTSVAPLGAQGDDASEVLLRLDPGLRYEVTHRSNLRISRNGRYGGLTSTELTGNLRGTPEGDAVRYRGTFWEIEQTIRGGAPAGRQVSRSIPADFLADRQGQMVVDTEDPYPLYRNFPFVPDEAVGPGDEWQQFGTYTIDARRDGSYLILPILVRYRYAGRQEYGDELAHRILADYAIRYPSSAVFRSPDNQIQEMRGRHEAEILLSADGRRTLRITTNIVEQIRFTDGEVIDSEGFRLSFFRIGEPLDRPAIQRGIAEDLQDADIQGVEVTRVEEGLQLRLNALQFVADSAVLLPGERGRLDAIAGSLAAIPERRFLVVGHTAATGQESNELDLSILRARTIVEALLDRGIAADRLFYEGRGSTQPIADNSTAEGRAANRRVEIVIID